MEKVSRCVWFNLKNQLYIKYHDTEWGVPLHDDQKLFELLCLEGAQAGLSWETILNKRQEYRKCFWDFNLEKILTKSDQELLQRMQEYDIVKNKLKVLAVKKNATAYKKVVAEHGTLDKYLWTFLDNKPIVNTWNNYKDTITQTEISEKLAKELKIYGFSFVGPVICYAFMQATGMVNDHEEICFCAEH